MIIACPTIQHTGSYFVVRHLFKGYKHLLFNQTASNDDCIYFDHVWPHKRKMIKEVCDNHPVIIPLRHPKVCALSWEHRGRELDDMCAMFREVVNVYDKYKPYYIPIDTDYRQSSLDSINLKLGLKLETTWPEVHSKQGNSEVRHTDLSTKVLKEGSKVDDLINEIQPFLNRFYAE